MSCRTRASTRSLGAMGIPLRLISKGECTLGGQVRVDSLVWVRSRNCLQILRGILINQHPWSWSYWAISRLSR
jgi:hypothetical protein